MSPHIQGRRYLTINATIVAIVRRTAIVVFKDDRTGHGDRTRKMNGLCATVFSVAIVVVIGCLGCRSTAVMATGLQRQQRLDRLHADDSNCRTAGWTQCVVQKVIRTIRLLEDSDSFQIADGLRLVKTAANTTDDRSTKYVIL